MDSVEGIVKALRAFNRARDWEQYHDPKNLSMAVASEAGELLAHFRWVSNADADAYAGEPGPQEAIAQEAADVGLTLLMFCDRIGIDLLEAMRAKLDLNATRYPVERSRGRWRDGD